MSGYPKEFKASTDPDDKSGLASFTVNNTKYIFKLESFEDFQIADKLLEEVFQQGKQFAAQAMRSHVENSLDRAESDHSLCDA